ncbi:MAG: S8/S53 family peptidase [Saccharofermentanales bacterium]
MEPIKEILFPNANSRNTYFTVHNIKGAQNTSKGKGIKVGVIDWLFAYEKNLSLYAGCANISGESSFLHEQAGHGLMMATTLREIAPECEVYAINATLYNNNGEINRIEYFEQAIDWAIENKINILTYSNAAFFGNERVRANEAVCKAVINGIITTFIHNDSVFNIWPYGCFGFGNDQKFDRQPDLNIFHFDYNSLYLPLYERYMDLIQSGEKIRSGNDLPFFSFSSMSPVLAGFAAILMSIKPSLTCEECKKILIETSYEIIENGENWYDLNPCKNVVDIGKAAELLLKSV